MLHQTRIQSNCNKISISKRRKQERKGKTPQILVNRVGSKATWQRVFKVFGEWGGIYFLSVILKFFALVNFKWKGFTSLSLTL